MLTPITQTLSVNLAFVESLTDNGDGTFTAKMISGAVFPTVPRAIVQAHFNELFAATVPREITSIGRIPNGNG